MPHVVDANPRVPPIARVQRQIPESTLTT
jgi:hypothetical protein